MMYILQLGAAVGVFSLLALIIWKILRRARRRSLQEINKYRDPYSREAFAELMEREYGTDRRLTQTVYDTTLNLLAYHNFIIYPSDDLYHVFGFSGNRIRDLMIDVFLTLEEDYPPKEEVEAYRRKHGKIKTMEQLIVFLDHWRKGEV